MKKMLQTIKLRKLKNTITKDSLKNLEGNEFYVLYQDNHTWDLVSKAELPTILIKPIHYIFDVTDRIVVDREILIDTNIKEEK